MMVLRHRGGNVLARLLMSLVLCSLVACGGNTRAPVEDREARSTPSAPVVASSSQANSRYRVQVGDTLYSIAFRYGLDYRKVAAANNIPGPYTIYPGQKIVLKEGAPPAVSTAPPAMRASRRSSIDGGIRWHHVNALRGDETRRSRRSRERRNGILCAIWQWFCSLALLFGLAAFRHLLLEVHSLKQPQ